jgi:hypothetical protein
MYNTDKTKHLHFHPLQLYSQKDVKAARESEWYVQG